ncbi:unnamed protein product [Pleuronectes platessa]|uniref:Uncharacterized protein n=1 Tax=Pleuronectes platessa TaxID=8262 RepID=A0A9N7UMA5_PLEPL|nr:unnamed protein product [Pleuronectes platessa]
MSLCDVGSGPPSLTEPPFYQHYERNAMILVAQGDMFSCLDAGRIAIEKITTDTGAIYTCNSHHNTTNTSTTRYTSITHKSHTTNTHLRDTNITGITTRDPGVHLTHEFAFLWSVTSEYAIAHPY